VAAAIQKLCPEILLILVTTAPRWLLESYIQGDFIYRPRAFDVGVVQADSLMMDKAATLAKLQQIRASDRSLPGKSTLSVKTAWVNPSRHSPSKRAIAASAGIPVG